MLGWEPLQAVSDRAQAARPLRWRYCRRHVYILEVGKDLGRTDYPLAGWELDLLGKWKALDGGNLIDRSHHVECRLVHKVGYSTHRGDLRGAKYIREDSSVYDAPRSARCDRTSC